MRASFLASSGIALAIVSGASWGQSSTRSYAYDELGRLIAATTSGGQNNAEAHSLCYDASGNRTRYRASLDGSLANCGAPAPTPSPTPTPTSGPTFNVGNASGTEGATLVFTVTRVGASGGSYSVSYATANGTAAAQDYYATSGTLTFGPGVMSLTVSVVTKTDVRPESTEVFYLNLSSPTGGATIGTGQGSGIIYDDGCALC